MTTTGCSAAPWCATSTCHTSWCSGSCRPRSGPGFRPTSPWCKPVWCCQVKMPDWKPSMKGKKSYDGKASYNFLNNVLTIDSNYLCWSYVLYKLSLNISQMAVFLFWFKIFVLGLHWFEFFVVLNFQLVKDRALGVKHCWFAVITKA